MPGIITSMPKTALPFTLSGVSMRLAGVPISVKSLGSLSATFSGVGSFAAASASSPYFRLWPVAGLITSPFSAWQDAGSTPHSFAAAVISMTRATAPARRSGSHQAGTEVEPPVTWNPSSGLA